MRARYEESRRDIWRASRRGRLSLQVWVHDQVNTHLWLVDWWKHSSLIGQEELIRTETRIVKEKTPASSQRTVWNYNWRFLKVSWQSTNFLRWRINVISHVGVRLLWLSKRIFISDDMSPLFLIQMLKVQHLEVLDRNIVSDDSDAWSVRVIVDTQRDFFIITSSVSGSMFPDDQSTSECEELGYNQNCFT